jgi:hypothetical protein
LIKKREGDPSVALSKGASYVSAAQAYNARIPIVVKKEAWASPSRGISPGNAKRGRRPAPF